MTSHASLQMSATRSRGDVEPTARVTMIGAGQLARMTHQAALDYGIALHVLASSPNDPAVTAGARYTLGRPDVWSDLREAAAHGEVTTCDHELVPIDLLTRLSASGVTLRPNFSALQLACDKLLARITLGGMGALKVPVPAFAPVATLRDVADFADAHGWPVVLKHRRGGYDGRGVQVVRDLDAARDLLRDSAPDGEASWLIEEHLELAGEFAILLARSPSGFVARYPAIRTIQREGICRELSMPADLPSSVTDTAFSLAESVVAGLDATGVCAVEFFWTVDGRLLLNELALRPHNSGHATIEACWTSQFHQHLRAILDWPLGATELVSPAATVNLIAGRATLDPRARLEAALQVPNTHIHLYQKEPRPGRKVGHVTALGRTTDDALEAARSVAGLLMQEGSTR